MKTVKTVYAMSGTALNALKLYVATLDDSNKQRQSAQKAVQALDAAKINYIDSNGASQEVYASSIIIDVGGHEQTLEDLIVAIIKSARGGLLIEKSEKIVSFYDRVAALIGGIVTVYRDNDKSRVPVFSLSVDDRDTLINIIDILADDKLTIKPLQFSNGKFIYSVVKVD